METEVSGREYRDARRARAKSVTRTRRGLVSEVILTPADGVPTDCVVDCVVDFDNIHTIDRDRLRRLVAALPRRGSPRSAGHCRLGRVLIADSLASPSEPREDQ